MIYIDNDFKCHTSNPDGTLTAVETDFFDGKCDAYIEGYRFVPAGATWTRPDGVVFRGEMIAPWKDWRELDVTKREYWLDTTKRLMIALLKLFTNGLLFKSSDSVRIRYVAIM